MRVDWNRYELANGVTLCMTALPAVIFATDFTDQKGMPAYIITWNNVLRITAPENLTGAPTPVPTPEQVKRTPSTVVKPITVDEPWSEFALKDGHTLRSRLIVTEIRHVSKMFDPTGMPLHLVSSQPVVDVSETQTDSSE